MGLWALIEELKSANKRLGAEVNRLRGERLVAYLAMRYVRIAPDAEAEGAVFELYAALLAVEEDAEASLEVLPELDDAPVTIRLTTLLNARKALARFDTAD
jgi:hypothetical protein